MVQLSSESAPSVSQVVAGVSNNNGPPAGAGLLAIPRAEQDVETTVEDLERDSEYIIYLVAEDNVDPSPNLQRSTTARRFAWPNLGPQACPASWPAQRLARHVLWGAEGGGDCTPPCCTHV